VKQKNSLSLPTERLSQFRRYV